MATLDAFQLPERLQNLLSEDSSLDDATRQTLKESLLTMVENGQLTPQPTTGYIYDYIRDVKTPPGWSWCDLPGADENLDEDGYPVDSNDMYEVWIIKDGSFLEQNLSALEYNDRFNLLWFDAPPTIAPKDWSAAVRWKN